MHVPNAPIGRAFDIELHCVTAIFAGCKGFDELAPFGMGRLPGDKGEVHGTATLEMNVLSPGKSGGLNGSTQHLARISLAVITKAKMAC